MRLEIENLGSIRGKSQDRLLRISGEICIAKVRKDLYKSGSSVLVVGGNEAHGKLPKYFRELHKNFSKKVYFSSGRVQSSEIGAWKRFLIVKQNVKKLKSGSFIGVVWDHGPVATLPIGKVGDYRVSITPLSYSNNRRGPDFFEDISTLEVIKEHFRPIFNEYFNDIFDLFQSNIFSTGKSHALETIRKVNKIIGGSIKVKCNLVRNATRDSRANKIRDEIQQYYRADLQVFEAVLMLINVFKGILKWVVLAGEYPSKQLDKFQEMIEELTDTVPERRGLRCCAEYLESPSLNSKRHNIGQITLGAPDWMIDAIEAAATLSIMIALLNKYGRGKVFVFVSHYFDTADTDNFFKRLEDRTKKEFRDKIVVWTGVGPTSDIVRSIIARIFLSDAFITYVPNSLEMYDSKQKEVKKGGPNWLINEALIAQSMGLVISQVTANNSKIVREILIQQVKKYNCSKLNPLICRKQSQLEIESHLNEFLRILKGASYVQIERSTKSFTEEEWLILINNVFFESVKRYIENIVTTVRLNFRADVWKVIKRISELINKSSYEKGVKISDLVVSFAKEFRKDGKRFNQAWIRRSLDKAVNVHVTINSQNIPLIVTSGKRPKYYRIALARLVSAVSDDFSNLDKKSEFYTVFWNQFRKHML